MNRIPLRQDRYGETVRQAVADGQTTTFPFPFSVYSIHDLQVWVDNILYDRGYRVMGAGRRYGGSVVFEAPPPAGARVTLKRHLLITRKASITVRGQVSVGGLNIELDSHIALMRQIEGEVSRCLTWPPGMSFVGRSRAGQIPAGRPVLPFPQPGQALGWSDDGRCLVNTPSILVRLAHVLEQLQTAGVLVDLPSEVRALARTAASPLSPPRPRGETSTRVHEVREVDPWTTAELGRQSASLSDEQAWTTRVIQTLQDTLQAATQVTPSGTVDPGAENPDLGDDGHPIVPLTAPLTAIERFGEIIPSVYVRAFPGRMPHVLRLTRPSTATRIAASPRREPGEVTQGALVAVAADTLRDDFSPDGQTYYGWRIEGPATNYLGGDLKTRLDRWPGHGLRVTAVPTAAAIPGGEADLLQTGTAVGLEATAREGRLISPPLSDLPEYHVPDRGVFSVWMQRLKGSGAIHLTSDKGVTWHDVSAQVTEGHWSRVWAPMKAVTCAPGIRLDRPRDAVAITALQYEAALGGDDPRPTSTLVAAPGGSVSGGSVSGGSVSGGSVSGGSVSGGSVSGSVSGGASTPLQRAGDVLRIEDISSRMTAAQGTIYLEALLAIAADDPQTLFSSSATPVAVEASVGDIRQGIALNVGGIASGFSGSTASGQPVQVGVPFRFALSWHREGIVAVHDGVVFCQSQRGTPWTCQEMALGCQLRNGPTRFLYGWIRRCAIFPERLTRQHLVAMTRS